MRQAETSEAGGEGGDVPRLAVSLLESSPPSPSPTSRQHTVEALCSKASQVGRRGEEDAHGVIEPSSPGRQAAGLFWRGSVNATPPTAVFPMGVRDRPADRPRSPFPFSFFVLQDLDVATKARRRLPSTGSQPATSPQLDWARAWTELNQASFAPMPRPLCDLRDAPLVEEAG